jgi:hypothetical protein
VETDALDEFAYEVGKTARYSKLHIIVQKKSEAGVE